MSEPFILGLLLHTGEVGPCPYRTPNLEMIVQRRGSRPNKWRGHGCGPEMQKGQHRGLVCQEGPRRDEARSPQAESYRMAGGMTFESKS